MSFWKGLSGETSCGCFGQVAVHPWYSFTLDTLAVAALLRARPAGAWRSASFASRSVRRRLTAVTVLWLLVGLPAGVAMESFQTATLTESGNLLGDSEFVVPKPKSWIGKRFPLLQHADIGDQLRQGMWIILLYDHRCSACRDAVSQYRKLARDFAATSGCPAIGLLECPPYTTQPTADDENPWVDGRLKNTRRWRLPWPAALLVDEGIIQSVFHNPRDTRLPGTIWGVPSRS